MHICCMLFDSYTILVAEALTAENFQGGPVHPPPYAPGPRPGLCATKTAHRLATHNSFVCTAKPSNELFCFICHTSRLIYFRYSK